MKVWVSQKLANWAIDMRADILPEKVLGKAEDCIIDAIACAIPGSFTDDARRIHSVASATYGIGEACLWFGSYSGSYSGSGLETCVH